MLAACSDGGGIGPRPAPDPLVAVEAYLQLYQPGPLPRLFQTTRIYDRHGALLAELFDEGRRTWVALDQISPHLLHATLATEDASFYSNPGIDPRRIVGAALQTLNEGQIVSGASTITMQLARNLFLGVEQRYDQSMDRKLLEAGIAQELTQQFSKDELLEMYLNLLNYGAGLYGPEAAARGYFGKPASELNLAEATLLAGIPQQPANLDLQRNLDAAKRRQRIVVELMVRHGYLTPEGGAAVLAYPIEINQDPAIRPVRAPHFVQYVIDTLDAKVNTGYTRRAGLSIITTLDWRLQERGQELVRAKVAELRPQYAMNNAALVSLKTGSAEILAMVGSADFHDDAIAGQVNVTTALRQPGSAIKPIVYAAAFDRNLISPASVLWDTPVAYPLPGGDVYTPLNYDRRFHGPVTARSALANSYNVPVVKLLDRLGVAELLGDARALGLTSLRQDAGWYGLSLAVGGGEVRLLDLTTAYHTLANGGRYLPPQAVLSITDSRGQPQAEDRRAPQPVLDEGVAFLLTDILADADARQPAFGAAADLQLSRPAAVKTGTTDDWRDNLTVGYTRHFVTGVWVGNTDGSPTQLSTGLTGAAPIWRAFMQGMLDDPQFLNRLKIPDEPSAWEFVPPPGVAHVDACPPGLTCRAGGEFFREPWLELMGEGGPLADSVLRCPADNPDGQAYFYLPGTPRPESDGIQPISEPSPHRLQAQEEARHWARQHGIPVTYGDCSQIAR